jgi:cell wall-associated NlpC family hydrolase
MTSLALAGAGTVALSGSAVADPNDLSTVRERMEQVGDEVDELYHEAEVANERYLQAQEKHAAAAEELASAQAAVERQKQKVADLTRSMGGFAAAAYRQGVVDPALQLVLSDNPQAALAESTMMDAFADQQSAALEKVAAERTALAQRQAGVAEQAAVLADLEGDMAVQKQAIDAKTQQAEDLLSSLQDRERQILAEIEARRQAEQERQAAALAASRDRTRQGAAPGAAAAGTPAAGAAASPPPAAPSVPVPASGRGGAAVAFALAQVGDSYGYGATGPNAWDCSGLTSGAWRAAGVSVPRTSQGQVYGLPRVSLNDLQPGDIIGYYGGASHVGLYIGNGQVVHSSRPGRPVSVVSLYSMPVVGAVRPG